MKKRKAIIKKKTKDYRVVCITWGDAFIDTEDFTLEDAIKTQPVYRKTVGFLIHKNKHGYVLATDIYPELPEISAKMFIPLGIVIKVKVLKI